MRPTGSLPTQSPAVGSRSQQARVKWQLYFKMRSPDPTRGEQSSSGTAEENSSGAYCCDCAPRSSNSRSWTERTTRRILSQVTKNGEPRPSVGCRPSSPTRNEAPGKIAGMHRTVGPPSSLFGGHKSPRSRFKRQGRGRTRDTSVHLNCRFR